MLNVTFFGTRGAAPVAAGATSRYGTHTACVALEVPGREPVLCDLGTGAGEWARALEPGVPRRASVLLSHPSPDRLSGLPLVDAAELDVFGPPAGRGTLGGVRYTSVDDEELLVGEAEVTVRSVAGDGAANGYRVEWEGVSVAYVGDHRGPAALDAVDAGAVDLADGADLLVHHATAEQAVGYALLVALEAGASCLALFGHPSDRTDGELDRILARARRQAERMGVDEVLVAAEGTTVSFERPAVTR